MAYKYTITVGGYDITNTVGTYVSELIPVYSNAVTTMDGVTHQVLIRTRSKITLTLHPRSQADTAAICNAFMSQPLEVYFYDAQNNRYRYADMICDIPSATLITGMVHDGKRWNELSQLVLEEL